MKKIKYEYGGWSLWSMGEDIQAPIAKLQLICKGFIATLTGMTWYASDARFALAVASLGFIVDLGLSCIWLKEIHEDEIN